MPWIHLMSSAALDAQTGDQIRQRILALVEQPLGRNPEKCMVYLSPGQAMGLGAAARGCAFVEVVLFGPAEPERKAAFVRELTDCLVAAISIEPECVYIKIEELSEIGSGGRLLRRE